MEPDPAVEAGHELLHAGAPRDPARSRTVVRFVKDEKEYAGITEASSGRRKVYTVAGLLGVSNFESSPEEGQEQISRCDPDAAAFMGRWLRGCWGTMRRRRQRASRRT